MKNGINWKIHEDPAKTQKAFEDLKKFSDTGDRRNIIKVLSKPENARSFIVRRGKGNTYIKYLIKGFCVAAGAQNTDEIHFDAKTIDFLHREKIPEQILVELMAAAYRLKKRELFFKIGNFIFKNSDKINDAEVVAAAFHESATWTAEIENDWQEAIKLNKKSMALVRENKLYFIENKLLFGLSLHKGKKKLKKLKLKERLNDFDRFARRFRELGDEYDALRADAEKSAVIWELALARGKREGGALMNEALELCKDTHRKAKRIEYPNAVIVAKEILSLIYGSLEKEISSGKYKKEAENMRREFDYPY